MQWSRWERGKSHNDFIPFIQVPETLNRADFLILTYNHNARYRGSGAKFYEYLAAAKPILVFGNSAANEIVKDLKIGWSSETPNPEILYHCLKKILYNKSELYMMGKLGKEYLIKNAAINCFGENWQAICKSLIK